MPSNTQNLDLYKKDPLNDGNDTFNIKTMMNDNWDKIDDVVGNLQKKQDEINSQQVSILKVKQNVSILSTGWVDDTATSGFWVYDISDADIDSNTVVDVNIHLTDLEKANSIKSVTESFTGYVRLYSSEQFIDDITCDLRLSKQAGVA